MKQIDLPIYIEVENGKVIAVWYDNEDGLDCLLYEGANYFVSYRTIPEGVKQHMKEHEHEAPLVNWLKPKLYQPNKDKEGEEDEK